MTPPSCPYPAMPSKPTYPQLLISGYSGPPTHMPAWPSLPYNHSLCCSVRPCVQNSGGKCSYRHMLLPTSRWQQL